MLLKIFDIYAFLTILTGTAAMACDGEDKFWSDIGDNSTVKTVFAQVCSSMTSDDDTGYRAGGCFNVGENHIDARVDIDAKFGNITGSDIALGCEGLFGAVKDTCMKGGSVDFDLIIFFGYATASAYPKANNCDEEA